MPILPGTRVGPYEVLSPLGAGGMGEVFRARDHRLAREVAVKFLPEQTAQAQAAVDRFIREARAASALNHPNIVTIHEIGDSDSGRYLVMELVQGRTLREIAKEGPSIEAAGRIGAQIAKALAVAHAAGIVHRDIKPENVMVREDGYVKVLDFGLARLLPAAVEGDGGVTTAGSGPGLLLGTLRYMSPEQACGDPAGAPSDVFSLGMVLYELVTGQHPFGADTTLGVLNAIRSQDPLPPSRLKPEVGPALETLILQMLRKEPQLRPSAADLAAALVGLSEQRGAAGASPIVMPSRRQTVGRDRERAELMAAFAATTAGSGQVICVSGEPGIGKTTLIEDFLEELAAGSHPCRIAAGRCSERLAGTEAYLPLLEALDRLVHRPSGDAMARTMKLLAPSWYTQIVPLTAMDSSAMRAAPDLRTISQERIKRELSAFLEEVCRMQPLVLVLDDVHWIDVSSVDVLGYLLARLDHIRVLVIAIYRPSELLSRDHPFLPIKLDLEGRGLSREIALSGLDLRAVERYLALEFPRHRFPPGFSDVIHRRTEGSPLFVVELLRYLRDRHIITQVRGEWRLAESAADIVRELPQSVRSMIQRKIDQLPDSERRLLVVAAVQGHEFHAAVVARVLQTDAAEVEERLVTLDRVHGFIRGVREEELPDRTLTVRYRFVHVLYQNALHDSLTPARRAMLSAGVAQALLAFYGEQSGSLASELALLFEAARDFPKAVEYFLRAARNAVRIAAYQEGVLLARHGLEVLKGVPAGMARDRQELALLVTLGVPLTATASYASPDVGQVYARAREICEHLGDSPELFPVLHGLYRFYFVRAELRISLELGERLLALADVAQQDSLRVEAHRAMGNTLFYRGELVSGREHLEAGLALYSPEQHRAHAFVYGINPGVASRSVLALALWSLGSADQARAVARESVAEARTLRHPFSLAWSLCYAALVLQNCGDAAGVRDCADEVIALAAEHGLPFWLAAGTILRGRARFDEAGGIPEALGEMQQGLDGWLRIGAQITTPYYLTLLAEVCAAADRPDLAEDALARAVAMAEQHEERWWLAEQYRLQGMLLTGGGLRGGAPAADGTGWLRKAADLAQGQRSLALELRALTSLAQVQPEPGVEATRQRLREVASRFTEGFDTADYRRAAALLDARA